MLISQVYQGGGECLPTARLEALIVVLFRSYRPAWGAWPDCRSEMLLLISTTSVPRDSCHEWPLSYINHLVMQIVSAVNGHARTQLGILQLTRDSKLVTGYN